MPESILLAEPSPLLLATGVEGVLQIGGQFFLGGLPQGFSPASFTANPDLQINGQTLQKVGGANLVYSNLYGVHEIPKYQPFSIYGAWLNPATTDYSIRVAVLDNFGMLSGMESYRYLPEEDQRFNVYENSVQTQVAQPCNNNEAFRIDSDGTEIILYLHTAGSFSQKARFPIPEGVLFYRFFLQVMNVTNSILGCYIRIDDVTIPVTTSNSSLVSLETPTPNSTIRIIDLSHYGVTHPFVANFNLELSNEHIEDTLQIPVDVAALFIRPVGQDCGSAVVAGTIVQFESNAGNGGLFEATGGTILANLQWQAPNSTGEILFTYTIGTVSASCILYVVPKLSVNGVNEDGYYADLAQGESVQFVATCAEATFECINFPTIMTDSGHLVAPTDAKDDVFGAKDCIIQVFGCSQTYQFKVHIQAMFPTPKFCGATPNKWRPPLIPDFLPNSLIMTGGSSQVKNRNKEGILIWNVEYTPLNQTAPAGCSCPHSNHLSNCEARFETAERLDDFYKQVRYNKYFTVLDYQTEIRYKYVRLTSFTGDHSLYRNEQTRSLTMRQEGDVLFE